MDEIKSLEEKMERASEALKKNGDSNITIVNHNDADGISARYILDQILAREGFDINHCSIERT